MKITKLNFVKIITISALCLALLFSGFFLGFKEKERRINKIEKAYISALKYTYGCDYCECLGKKLAFTNENIESFKKCMELECPGEGSF